jgi:hypothetical protein
VESKIMGRSNEIACHSPYTMKRQGKRSGEKRKDFLIILVEKNGGLAKFERLSLSKGLFN